MTIRTERWKPDTCECVIFFDWDDTLSEAARVHTLSSVVSKCPAHSSLPNATLYSALTEENPRKNIALERVLANAPLALYDIVDGSRQLKGSLRYDFSWSGSHPNRVLTISFFGISLTTNQKNTIQTALNTRFGSGKVLIV